MRSGRSMSVQHQRRFARDVLELLRDVEEVQIEPRSSDGASKGPVTTWVVTTGDDVYVRSYRGPRGRWYQALLAHPEGVLHVGPREVPFRAVHINDSDTIAQASEAYRRKYARKWSKETADMLVEEVLPTTLRLEPST